MYMLLYQSEFFLLNYTYLKVKVVNNIMSEHIGYYLAVQTSKIGTNERTIRLILNLQFLSTKSL